MFRFEYSDHLWAFASLPILLGFFLLMWYARKQAIRKFGNWSLMQQLMPQMSRYKHGLKFAFVLVALSFFILAWANPQWGTKKEKVKRKSVDVFIALDISESMLAQDISPNRLERAKNFCRNLVRELRGERIGFIIFAGNAYLQMPLTTDYAAAELFMKSANTRQAPTQGTAISDAIDLAERAFEPNNKQHKALVIITDGENHDEVTLERAQEASENGLLIFPVGVGTPDGGYIPTPYSGRGGFKVDENGEYVRTRLNQQMLQDLAAAGKGLAYNIAEGDQIIPELRARIDQVEKREFEQRSFNEYESYFQYFIGIGLIFLLMEFIISYRKNRWFGDKDLFKT